MRANSRPSSERRRRAPSSVAVVGGTPGPGGKSGASVRVAGSSRAERRARSSSSRGRSPSGRPGSNVDRIGRSSCRGAKVRRTATRHAASSASRWTGSASDKTVGSQAPARAMNSSKAVQSRPMGLGSASTHETRQTANHPNHAEQQPLESRRTPRWLRRRATRDATRSRASSTLGSPSRSRARCARPGRSVHRPR